MIATNTAGAMYFSMGGRGADPQASFLGWAGAPGTNGMAYSYYATGYAIAGTGGGEGAGVGATNTGAYSATGNGAGGGGGVIQTAGGQAGGNGAAGWVVIEEYTW